MRRKGEGFSVLARFQPELMLTSEHAIGVKRFGEIRVTKSTMVRLSAGTTGRRFK